VLPYKSAEVARLVEDKSLGLSGQRLRLVEDKILNFVYIDGGQKAKGTPLDLITWVPSKSQTWWSRLRQRF